MGQRKQVDRNPVHCLLQPNCISLVTRNPSGQMTEGGAVDRGATLGLDPEREQGLAPDLPTDPRESLEAIRGVKLQRKVIISERLYSVHH